MLVDNQVRHFLKPVDAKYEGTTAKRLRLSKRKHEQIANAGGMLMGSEKQIKALREIGVSEVLINTDKSDVIPDLPELKVGTATKEPRKTAQKSPPAVTQRTAEGGYKWLTPEGEAEWVWGKTPVEDAALDSLAGPGDEEADVAAAPAQKEARPSQTEKPRQPLSAQDTERRKNFGPKNTGWMKIEVTPDNNQAFLQVLSFGGDATLGTADVLAAVNDLYGIVVGVDEGMVVRLAEQAASSPDRVIRGHFAVAAIADAELDRIGSIEYTFRGGLPEGEELDFEALSSAYEGDSPDDVVVAKTTARAVIPGEELCRFVASDHDEGARDIFGNLRPSAGHEAVLTPGSNVEVIEESYIAQIYGYVCLSKGSLSVLSPIWVSPDHMQAHYVHLPQAVSVAPLTRDWLDDILDALNVVEGLDEVAIERVITAPPSADMAKKVLIASGTPPEDGEAGRVKFTFDAEATSGLQGDGSIDLDAREEASKVDTDQLLAEVFPAMEGKPGVDLAGNEVEGLSGERNNVRTGDNVRSEYLNKNWCYFAKVAGKARLQGDVISVQPVFYYNGNVDNDLVFDDASKEVRIKGSIRAGVNVKAASNLSVDGMIEGGATVAALGDVTIGKGVIGHYTKITASGDVETKFVQQGSLVARGDVNITSHLINARVRAGGKMSIKGDGGEKGGIVVGGEVIASGGLELSQVGSPTVEGTVIGIAADPELAAKMKKLDRGIDFCRSNILRIFRTMGMSEINVAHFKELIEKNPPHKRKPMMKVLTQLRSLADTREKSVAARKDLEKALSESLDAAEIKVEGNALAGVKIMIGNEAMTLDNDLENPTFTRAEQGGITWTRGGEGTENG